MLGRPFKGFCDPEMGLFLMWRFSGVIMKGDRRRHHRSDEVDDCRTQEHGIFRYLHIMG